MQKGLCAQLALLTLSRLQVQNRSSPENRALGLPRATVLMGGTWVRCHAEVAAASHSGVSAGHQDNFVQRSELTHGVTTSYVTAQN